MSIRQEVSLPAPPARVFELLTEESQFAAATGMPARMGRGEGAAFSLFDGHVEGRHLELVAGQRIVQAWRGVDWESGTYSVVRFTLRPAGTGTTLVLDQDAYPAGASPLYPSWHEHLATNWPVFYFGPLKKYLSA
jgi:uncharacterized protein YndB with AHSA1/START domain